MNGIIVIICFVLGFTIAQLIKFFVFLAKGGSLNEAKSYLTRSGGMPSGHSASITAATIYLGFSQGFNSPIFALALCLSVIIIYDAVNVRYATGEQGKVINKLLSKTGRKEKLVRIVEGHTLPEALAGIALGLLIGALMFFFFG